MKTLLLSFIFIGIFSSFINYNKTGTGESNIIVNKVVISPNPARTFTNVIVKDVSLKILKVSIYTIVGNEVLSLDNIKPTKSLEMNVFKLAKGKYLVKVYLSDGTEEITTLIKL